MQRVGGPSDRGSWSAEVAGETWASCSADARVSWLAVGATTPSFGYACVAPGFETTSLILRLRACPLEYCVCLLTIPDDMPHPTFLVAWTFRALRAFLLERYGLLQLFSLTVRSCAGVRLLFLLCASVGCVGSVLCGAGARRLMYGARSCPNTAVPYTRARTATGGVEPASYCADGA